MVNVFLTTRTGCVQEIPLYHYRFSDHIITDSNKKNKLTKWLKYGSNFPIYKIDNSSFSTFKQLCPSELNHQYFYEQSTVITAPFENTQLISCIIGNFVKYSLSQKFEQYLHDNIFIVSEIVIHPFKLLKGVEFNIEVFQSGHYLINFLPVTKIISDQSPITDKYLLELRANLKKQSSNDNDIHCTLIDQNEHNKRQLDLLNPQAFNAIQSALNDKTIKLATFNYHFLATYSSGIFRKIISETCKKLKDLILFTDKVLSELSLPDFLHLSPDRYLKTDIVQLNNKYNLYVGCQYDETLTLHAATPTQYGLRIEYTRDDISPEELIINFIKDQHVVDKFKDLTLPIKVRGKINYRAAQKRAFLVDFQKSNSINATLVAQQSAAYYTGIYKPVQDFLVLPILYRQQECTLFKDLIQAFNRNKIDLLDPYIITGETIDIAEIKQRIAGKKKVFMPIICRDQMPKSLLQSIRSLHQKYQIYLGETSDTKDNRARLSNYVCKCLEKMGGIISLIADTSLPDSGYFIGLDLGHTTNGKDKFSNIGVALFNNYGLLIDQYVLKNLPRNENLNYQYCKIILDKFNHVISKNNLLTPTHIVIHRDGKLHKTDINSLLKSIENVWGSAIKTDIVEIIKSGFPIIVLKTGEKQVENPPSGYSYQNTSHRYALLVTNTQANEYENLIKPIIIKHRYGDSDFKLIVEQVYWFTKIYTNNLYHCTRLPATTQKANNIAGTSNKIHQATYLG